MANGAYYVTNGVAREISRQYIGVNGVARTASATYRFIGVDGVARRISTAYVGIENTFRVPTATNLYYTVQKIDPYPQNGNTQNATFGAGTVTLYQNSTTPSEIAENRTIVRAYLYGLNVGDIITFDYNYNGPGTSSSTIYYIDAIVAFGTTGDRIFLVHRDGSGSIEHTVTEEDVSRVFLRFEVNNGRGANQTQTFTITNLKVNGQPVICEEVTI